VELCRSCGVHDVSFLSSVSDPGLLIGRLARGLERDPRACSRARRAGAGEGASPFCLRVVQGDLSSPAKLGGAMDIAGAEALSWRLAQQEHWVSARAVRLGLQPSIDPDGHALESFHGELRIYRAPEQAGSEGGAGAALGWVRKRLVEGAWEEEAFERTVRRGIGPV
jgi:hypothetical protein